MDAKLLEEALIWTLEKGASIEWDSADLSDAGCGCCSKPVEPPAALKEVVEAAAKEALKRALAAREKER